ncbi:MAG TPA: molybdenum cofactor biosynthesis protein MoaE [Anaerolineae bacterium]|nr:molybdenum cofactor biosynthesis protein MoaE [Anaerolineae bacterium]
MSDNKVHVKFFAIFREYVGLKEDWREIEPGTTVQELWNYYTANAKNPRVANIRAAFSVNQRLAKPDTVLNGGEEVGFLPPVSGGASTRTKRTLTRSAKHQTPRKTSRNGRASRTTPKRRSSRATKSSLARDFVVTDKALSLDALIERVAHPGAGGITVFLGVVRDNARDRDVKFLEYEAYPELAEQVLVQIGDEAQQRWTDVRLAIAHRTGRLQIGEASVIIAASAPHRAEAFAACRYAIERLKVILPVWKKEFASDTEYWVEGPTPGEVPPERAEQSVREAEIV